MFLDADEDEDTGSAWHERRHSLIKAMLPSCLTAIGCVSFCPYTCSKGVPPYIVEVNSSVSNAKPAMPVDLE